MLVESTWLIKNLDFKSINKCLLLMEMTGNVKHRLKLMEQLYQLNHILKIMLVQDIFTLLLSNIVSEDGFWLLCNQTMVIMIIIDLVKQTIQLK